MKRNENCNGEKKIAMPCVVDLEYSYILIVKSSWCENFNSADVFNGGYKADKRMKIFHSPNKAARANFELEPQEQFNGDVDAVYYGYILEVFGK